MLKQIASRKKICYGKEGRCLGEEGVTEYDTLEKEKRLIKDYQSIKWAKKGRLIAI